VAELREKQRYLTERGKSHLIGIEGYLAHRSNDSIDQVLGVPEAAVEDLQS